MPSDQKNLQVIVIFIVIYILQLSYLWVSFIALEYFLLSSEQYCGGGSVLWGVSSVIWWDTISTLEGVQYYGGKLQALLR